MQLFKCLAVLSLVGMAALAVTAVPQTEQPPAPAPAPAEPAPAPAEPAPAPAEPAPAPAEPAPEPSDGGEDIDLLEDISDECQATLQEVGGTSNNTCYEDPYVQNHEAVTQHCEVDSKGPGNCTKEEINTALDKLEASCADELQNGSQAVGGLYYGLYFMLEYSHIYCIKSGDTYCMAEESLPLWNTDQTQCPECWFEALKGLATFEWGREPIIPLEFTSDESSLRSLAQSCNADYDALTGKEGGDNGATSAASSSSLIASFMATTGVALALAQ